MNLSRIIRHAERLDTAALRLIYTFDGDARRAALVKAFEAMCTDLGKLVVPCGRPDWTHVQARTLELRMAAIKADEARAATFSHVGAEAALITSLFGFAAMLGFTLEDAATAGTGLDDDAAMAAVEGGKLEAAE